MGEFQDADRGVRRGLARLRPPAWGCHNRRMALDVQPLSLRRRIVRILVMLALLGAALGFAEVLIRRSVRFSLSDPRDMADLNMRICVGGGPDSQP
jgi:hypothetical protein